MSDPHDDEAPTEYPAPPARGTLTFTPEFKDNTDSVFDPTTRRVSKKALAELIASSKSGATAPADPVGPSTAELSPEFLERLREVRRQGVDAAGTPFGDYVLFGVIGRGGMAEVRLAAGARDGDVRLAVVKVMLPNVAEIPALRQLFVEEGLVCSCLHHPGIVELYDRGEADGVPYLAFELVDGISLRELMKLIDPTRVPLRAVLEIGALAADALAYAHAAVGPDGQPLNVVHRDVTPHNVLIARDGSVKLVDFGIARFSGRDTETRHGQLRGKLGYMAPEQCRYGPVDGRADIFALGLILAELIGGRRVLPPAMMIITENEKAVRDCLSDATYPVPDAVVELLLRMTAVEAAERMQTAAEASSRLSDLANVTGGDGLVDFISRDVFSRLMPLDFATITAEPTSPSIEIIDTPPMSSGRVRITEDSDDDLEDDDEEEAEPAYSRTVRRLRNVQKELGSIPSDEGVAPTRRVERLSTGTADVSDAAIVDEADDPAPPKPIWPWVVVAFVAAATAAYVAVLAASG